MDADCILPSLRGRTLEAWIAPKGGRQGVIVGSRCPVSPEDLTYEKHRAQLCVEPLLRRRLAVADFMTGAQKVVLLRLRCDDGEDNNSKSPFQPVEVKTVFDSPQAVFREFLSEPCIQSCAPLRDVFLLSAENAQEAERRIFVKGLFGAAHRDGRLISLKEVRLRLELYLLDQQAPPAVVVQEREEKIEKIEVEVDEDEEEEEEEDQGGAKVEHFMPSIKTCGAVLQALKVSGLWAHASVASNARAVQSLWLGVYHGHAFTEHELSGLVQSMQEFRGQKEKGAPAELLRRDLATCVRCLDALFAADVQVKCCKDVMLYETLTLRALTQLMETVSNRGT